MFILSLDDAQCAITNRIAHERLLVWVRNGFVSSSSSSLHNNVKQETARAAGHSFNLPQFLLSQKLFLFSFLLSQSSIGIGLGQFLVKSFWKVSSTRAGCLGDVGGMFDEYVTCRQIICQLMKEIYCLRREIPVNWIIWRLFKAEALKREKLDVTGKLMFTYYVTHRQMLQNFPKNYLLQNLFNLMKIQLEENLLKLNFCLSRMWHFWRINPHNTFITLQKTLECHWLKTKNISPDLCKWRNEKSYEKWC